MQEMWVRSLGQEDPLGEGMATSSILAWRIPYTLEPGGLESMGSQRFGREGVTNTCDFTLLQVTVISLYIHFLIIIL